MILIFSNFAWGPDHEKNENFKIVPKMPENCVNLLIGPWRATFTSARALYPQPLLR